MLFLLGTVAIIISANAQPLVSHLYITTSKPDGIYHSGETVSWYIQPNDDTTDFSGLRYTLREGEITDVGHGDLDFGKVKRTSVRYKFTQPGYIQLVVEWGPKDSPNGREVSGALADPDSLKLSAKEPAHFWKFWKDEVKNLEAIPENAKLEKGESGKDGVDYYKISMDNINGSHIQGQLARPTAGDKLPALLIVQWAGVYALDKSWAVDRAAQGWLVLNIEAHDLPIDAPADFYKQQSEGPLKDYWTIGNDDPEKSYFLRMYLSCYRACDYLEERPDWDGKTLVVMGASQGGLQALMTAGFHKDVSAAIALVPAGFDMLGPAAGRKGGWPQWYDKIEGKDSTKVREASQYFDVANFVPHIKCPILVGVGLLDETCPPAGILASLVQLKTPKTIMILPRSGHQDRGGSQAAFRTEQDEVWLPDLVAGKPLPVH